MFGKVSELRAKASDVLSIFRRMVSIGIVSQVDSELRRVKVTFPYGGYPESDWLSVVSFRSKQIQVNCNLEAGEQVLCLFIPTGSMIRGFVLGALGNANAKPYSTDVNKFGILFKDNTLLEYDQGTQTGVLKIKGGEPSITVTPEGVTVDTPKYTVNAQQYTVNASDGILLNGKTHITKALTGDMTAIFQGTVGAAGYSSPTGGVAKLDNGVEIKITATYKGKEITHMGHTHEDGTSAKQ